MIVDFVIPAMSKSSRRMTRFQRCTRIIAFLPGVAPLAFTFSALGAFLGSAPLALFSALRPWRFSSRFAR